MLGKTNKSETSERLNSISTRPKQARSGKTITITLPRINRPKINLKRLLTSMQALFLVLVLVVGVVAGFLGGLIESVGYNGKVYTASISQQSKIIPSNNQLIVDIAKKLSPSVVSVNATSNAQSTPNFFGFSQQVQQQSEGTGIIISSNGLVLTNRHVVPAGTSSVSITLSNGTQLNDVTVVGRTSPSDSLDIAILKINNTQGQKLTPAVIGDSSTVQVGDGVVAIGNALGQFQNTVTSGIISGYGRNITASSSSGGSNSLFLPYSGTSTGSSENLSDLFQTDAAINEGNSGGPLVNLNGQVIGVNTAIASNSQNIGFAIPINEVKGLIKEVVKTGKFKRPFLGVRYIPVTPAVKSQYHLSVNNGAYIPKGSSSSPSIVAGTPAAKAKLKPGDVITKINNTSLNLRNDLATVIDQFEPGQSIKLTVVNGSNTRTVQVKLGVAPN